MAPYTAYKKTKAMPEDEPLPDDCYGKQARLWLWLLGLGIAGTAVYVVVMFTGQSRSPLRADQRLPHHVARPAQLAALTPCPYCPGSLDAQGRCNVRKCPIYSPDWGKGGTAKKKTTVQEPIQIKELALEVMDLLANGPVAIHAVYAGGVGDKAQLREGDILRRFNGRKVTDLEQFQAAVARAAPESNVKIEVIRNQKKKQLVVMVGEGEMEGAVIPVMNPAPVTQPGRAF
ncbi:PDZ domain-containing protein [Verrucomicrobiota bacterium]